MNKNRCTYINHTQRYTQTNIIPRSQGAYSLIELLVVIAIIGILSVIAIPNYQNYVGRAQFANAMDFGTRYRVAIEDLIFNVGKFPEGNAGLIEVFGELVKDEENGEEENAVTFERLELIEEIELTADEENALNGTLVINLETDESNTSGLNAGIRGKKITFTRDNANWVCKTDAPKKMVPKGCKPTV